MALIDDLVARIDRLEAPARQRRGLGPDETLLARIEALEARLRDAVPGIRYRGVWREGEEYLPGDVATHRGALWFCSLATTAKPFDDQSPAWQMCVKAGRDGKDADIRALTARVARLEQRAGVKRS